MFWLKKLAVSDVFQPDTQEALSPAVFGGSIKPTWSNIDERSSNSKFSYEEAGVQNSNNGPGPNDGCGHGRHKQIKGQFVNEGWVQWEEYYRDTVGGNKSSSVKFNLMSERFLSSCPVKIKAWFSKLPRQVELLSAESGQETWMKVDSWTQSLSLSKTCWVICVCFSVVAHTGEQLDFLI